MNNNNTPNAEGSLKKEIISYLVSVIIPAYNHELYIQDCIKSIINQTYKDIELIVIDDGSKDSTYKKIQEMKEACEKRFVRVHIETKPNEGTCNTLNKLISHAKGEFVYLIASDDMSKPEAIEKEISFLKENPDYVLVVGDNEFIDSSSKRIGWDDARNPVELSKAKYRTFGESLKVGACDVKFESSQFGRYDTLVLRNYIPNGYLIRKDALDKIGHFTPEAPLEDWWMHLQLSKIGKYKYIDEVLFSYRWHSANTIKQEDKARYITLKTRNYEKDYVASLEDKKWRKIFDKKDRLYRTRFNVLNIAKNYYVENYESKKDILELFGFKIVLKEIKNNYQFK